MGFTLVHPAAIVPVWAAARRRLPLPALVIGALSPDFEYLLRLEPIGDAGHSIAGIFAFCLPLSLVALFTFESVVREPMTRLLALPSRLGIAPPRTAAWLAASAIAIVIGAATHVGWDAVTHGDGWIVSAWPELRNGSLESFRWSAFLQRTSSFLGFGVLLAALAASRDVRAATATVVRSPSRLGTLGALLVLASLVAIANGVRGAESSSHHAVVRFFAYAAVGGMDGMIAAVLGYSLRQVLGGVPRAISGAIARDAS